MNPEWCVLYPEAKITHLTRCHSDHCPVLLEISPGRALPLTRPFRFQEFWLSDTSFPSIVSKAWHNNRVLVESIDSFSKEATLWNKNRFGNINYKKKRILARLYGIQKALSNCPSASLLTLKKQLLWDLDLVLNQERDLWLLKSRVNWMIQGDRNTSFYHMSTLARRKRNHIASVKDAMVEWNTNDREVSDYFCRGFILLYSTSHDTTNCIPHLSVQWHGRMSEEVKCSLSTMVSSEEIKGALWSMKPYKVPGPNGLHTGFFQRFWLITGASVTREVERVFATSSVPDYLNKTLIVLILKM